MKKIMMAALMMAVCLSAGAKKKEVKEILFGVKSGVITVTSDMGDMPDFSQMAAALSPELSQLHPIWVTCLISHRWLLWVVAAVSLLSMTALSWLE